MSRYLSAVVLSLSAVVLAGCLTTDKVGVKEQVRGHSLAGVEVTIKEGAFTGLFERIDDLDDEEFASRFKGSLERAMTRTLAASFPGGKPVQVLVHVDEMNIASGAGRALLGKRSYVGARVQIVDTSTLRTIAERHFREQEKDVSFTGNIGILVEITKNVIDAGTNDMVEDAAQEFADRVEAWLAN